MSEQQDRERLVQADRLLDRALARYAGEPLAGFERRMVRRLRWQQHVFAPALLSWRRIIRATAIAASLAVTAAASLSIGVYLGQKRANSMWQQGVGALTVATLAKQGTPTTSAAPATAPPWHTSCFPRAEKQLAVPRSSRHAAQFPTPAPLSAQERALSAIAVRGNRALLSSLIHPVSATDNPPESSMFKEPPPNQ
jgi:negative regulator of sigma E activity